MPENHINWNLLVRYISGSMTSEEAQRVRVWIDSDPENEKFLIYLRKIWDRSEGDKQGWDIDAAWVRFKDQSGFTPDDLDSFDEQIKRSASEPLAADPSVSEPLISDPSAQGTRWHETTNFRATGWYNRSVVAAIFLVVILVTSAVLPYLYSQSDSESGVPVAELREIVTKNGQRTHLNLSDGSRIILNAGSRIVLPEYFPEGAPREVFLSGEAYFEVADDSARPFYVYTDEAVTRVVGTIFEIRSYPDEGPVQVVVAEGEVELQDREQNLQAESITRNRMGLLFHDGQLEITDVQDISLYFGWTEGRLIFNREPLQNAIPRLERWYDVRIGTDALDKEQLRKVLTAEFTDSQPLEEVMEAIAITLEMSYTKLNENSHFEFLNINY